MPIWLRSFTYDRMDKYYKKQNEEKEGNNIINDPKKISKPGVTPKDSYTTKATKKQ